MQSKVQSNSQNTLTANKFYFAVITLSSLLFFAFCIYSPDQNWDMLGYSASAISFENNDPEFIHNYIYSELESYASDSELTKLTAGNDYAVAMHQDANAFYQQIPYYKIRIVFVGLTYMLTKIGINIFSAAHMITAAAGSLGLMLVFLCIQKIHKTKFLASYPFFLCFMRRFRYIAIRDRRYIGVSMDRSDLLFFYTTTLVCFPNYCRSCFDPYGHGGICRVSANVYILLLARRAYARFYNGDCREYFIY